MHELNLLGSITLRTQTGDERLLQPKRIALLVYLLLSTPRGFRTRDELLAMFWPDSDQTRGRASLRKASHRLRRALGPEAIEGDLQRLRANPEHICCDVLKFEESLEEGRLPEAAALYGGDLLAGFHVSGAPAFHRWLDLERQRLRRRAVETYVQLADEAAATGNQRAAARWVRQAVRTDPFDEALAHWGARLLLDLGERTAAIRLLELLVRRLEQEWEVPPAPETLELLHVTRSSPPSGSALGTRSPQPSTPTEPSGAVPSLPLEAARGPPEVTRPTPPPGPYRTRRIHIRRGGTLAGTAALALTALALLLTRGEPAPREVAGTGVRVAVLPVQAPDSASRGLAEALDELVVSGLSTFAGIELLGLPSTPGVNGARALHHRPEEQALYEEMGADVVFRSRVWRADERLFASVELWEARTNRWAGPFLAEAEPDSLFSLADRLIVTLVARGLVSDRGPLSDPELPPGATTSSVALRAFLEGERFLRRGQWPEAVVRYRAAAAADTAFAMAWFRLGQTFDQLARPGALAFYRRALAHPDRLRNRESSLVRGALLVAERRREAVDTLRALVARHPFYPEAWAHLGAAYFHVGRRVLATPEDYRRALSRAVELDPGSVWPYVHLIEDAFVRGDVTRGRDLVAGLQAASGSTEYGTGFAVARDLAWGDEEARHQAAASLNRLSPRLRGPLARAMTVLELNPDFEPLLREVADARLRQATSEAERDNTQSHILRLLPRAGQATAGLEILRARMGMHGSRRAMARSIITWHTVGYQAVGYAEEALVVLREAEQPSVREMFWIGAYGLVVRDSALFRTQVAALRSRARADPSQTADSGGSATATALPYAGLVADALEALAIADHDPGRAIAVLRRVHDSRDPEVTDDGILDYIRIRLGRLYREEGQLERALRHFMAQNHHADLHVAPLELEVARTLAAMGRDDEAREHYARFARWWRDCDPSLYPLRDEAIEVFTAN